MADLSQIVFTDNPDEVAVPVGGWESVEGPKPPKKKAPPPEVASVEKTVEKPSAEAENADAAGGEGTNETVAQDTPPSAGTGAAPVAGSPRAVAQGSSINIQPSSATTDEPTEVRGAVFSDLQPGVPVAGPTGTLNLLMDVSVSIAVELGKTTMKIEDLLRLSSGAVIKLDKLVDEPVDLLVNGRLIARGEIVVVDDYFGIRVSEVVQ
ncbi:MAG: flagellar motor switch protein FliN [Planctomycetes bacterium]|nr:flagellar motor switch protein FliN [Planctomycetota bacterium]